AIVPAHAPRGHEAGGKDHGRSTRAKAPDRADKPPRKVEKTMDLALRIVKASGPPPAVGPAENRPGAVGCVDTLQFRRDEFERPGPRDRYELVTTPPFIRSRTVFQPAASNHRPSDPCRVRDRGRNIAEQRRRIDVLLMRQDLDAFFAEEYREGAPVGAVRQTSSSHGSANAHATAGRSQVSGSQRQRDAADARALPESK